MPVPHIDLGLAVAGLLVGFTVGLTGMGGGALMTPVLVLLFKVPPLAAVSSDLVAAVVMKPIGGAVHARRGTVHKGLVRWLVTGSVPGAFLGVLVLESLGNGDALQDRLKIVLGVALLLAVTAMTAKSLLRRKAAVDPDVTVKPLPTLLIGLAGGLVVGMTSVGSGSLMMVLLLLLYPTLTTSSLVGTDLVQAIPLVGAAALGHLLFGDVRLGLTTSLLVGSVPGVWVGARVSSRASDRAIRPALVAVLSASALKLLGVPTGVVLVVGLVAASIPEITRLIADRLQGRAKVGVPVVDEDPDGPATLGIPA
jgi:uncharacterized membrane protein YfcA